MPELKKVVLEDWMQKIAERFNRDLSIALTEGKYNAENPVPALKICNAYNTHFAVLFQKNGKLFQFTPKHLRKIAIALLSDGHPILFTENDEYYYSSSTAEMDKFIQSLKRKRERIDELILYAESTKQKKFEIQLELLPQ